MDGLGFFSDVVSKRTKVAHQVLNDAKHRTREFHDCVRTLVTEKMVFFMEKFYQLPLQSNTASPDFERNYLHLSLGLSIGF